MRVLLALGGNAMTAADGSATPDAQRAAIAAAMESVAGLIAAGHEVVITHGNGPQVGNLLVKNELAATVVPAGAPGLVRCADPGHDRLHHPQRARAQPRRGRRVPSGGRHRDPHPGRRERPRLRPPDQARGPVPALRAGQAAHRARPAVGGPRREGVAPHGGLPRAGRGARDRHADDAARRRLRRRRCRRRRHPGRARQAGRCLAGSRRSSTRTSPRRCSPGRSRPTCSSSPRTSTTRSSATARPRPRRSRTVTLEQMRDIAAAGPLRQRVHGAQGRGGDALRRVRWPAIGHHRTRAHREGHHR